jgi:imidazole glycerol-phosphate synthase subunit HisH
MKNMQSNRDQIVIIDYGMGNLFSIEKAFNRIRVEPKITNSRTDILAAQKIILPGVGNFKRAMSNLHQLGLIDVLEEKVIVEKIPILGICLGMQLFTKYSEEGQVPGLGWLNASTLIFPATAYKVPHIGWNTIKHNNSILYAGIPIDSEFYFVHSYFVDCANQNNVMSTSEYGIEFHSSIQGNNIFGVQFHPEKSHSIGLRILNNFMNL